MHWNQVVQVQIHITPTILKVLLFKSKSVLKCWDQWLLDGLAKKLVLNQKMMIWGTTFKILSAEVFSGKETFLESVFFNSEMLGMTYFGRVLVAMIDINKYSVKCSRKHFMDFSRSKIWQFGLGWKYYALCFFFKSKLEISLKISSS